MPDDPIQSNWAFQPFAEWLEGRQLQSHSSRVVLEPELPPISEPAEPETP